MMPVIPPGLGIAIVAPGGYAPDVVALDRAVVRLQALGCIVKIYSDPNSRHQRFGATDEARAAQMHAAVADPEVRLVIALRGGYGMSRLLDKIDFGRIAASGKLIVGHSDVTALQMPLLKAGGISFAGPMICDDFTREEPSAFTMTHFWQCVTRPVHVIDTQASGNPALDTSGTLWGGNLAMLTHLAGTPYLPQVDGGILFVEDINEHPYRVERMLLQLFHAGALTRQKALLLGDFSGYRLSDYDNGYDFETMLAFLRARLPVPVLTGLPFGHVRDKATLAVGASARLESDASGFRLTMSGYPTL
jgi:muramoyltetrapeptide carboxypeptidase